MTLLVGPSTAMGIRTEVPLAGPVRWFVPKVGQPRLQIPWSILESGKAWTEWRDLVVVKEA